MKDDRGTKAIEWKQVRAKEEAKCRSVDAQQPACGFESL